MEKTIQVKIDFITKLPDGGCKLYLVEVGPWSDEEKAQNLHRLGQRICDCVTAIINGHIAQRFPATMGEPITIEVESYDTRDPGRVENSAIHALHSCYPQLGRLLEGTRQAARRSGIVATGQSLAQGKRSGSKMTRRTFIWLKRIAIAAASLIVLLAALVALFIYGMSKPQERKVGGNWILSEPRSLVIEPNHTSTYLRRVHGRRRVTIAELPYH